MAEINPKDFTPANQVDGTEGIPVYQTGWKFASFANIRTWLVTLFEAKNTNIQAHIATTHAPSNAQKNSDITKAEIEAKLTGAITTHSHTSSGTVNAVNSVLPDVNGNITLIPSDVGAEVSGTATTLVNAHLNDATDAHAASAITQSATHRFVSDVEKSNWNSATVPSALLRTITQASPAFAVGQPVYVDASGVYQLADASADATADVEGIVSVATVGGTFTLTLPGGYITGMSGLTAGTVYYLSETAGALTATAPVTVGAINKPVLKADSTTSGYVLGMRGMENVDSDAFVLVNLLDYIPTNLHAGIRDGSNSTPLDSYIALALADGLVFAPNGTYLHAAAIDIPNSNSGIIGQSYAGVKFVTPNSITGIKLGKHSQGVIPSYSATYTRSGTTLTVTHTGHTVAMGTSVYLSLDSPDVITEGWFTVATVVGDTFTITVANSGGTSGNITYQKRHGSNSFYSETVSYNSVLENFTMECTNATKTNTIGIDIRRNINGSYKHLRIWGYDKSISVWGSPHYVLDDVYGAYIDDSSDHFEAFLVGQSIDSVVFLDGGLKGTSGVNAMYGPGNNGVITRIIGRGVREAVVYGNGIHLGDTLVQGVQLTNNFNETDTLNGVSVKFVNPGDGTVTYANKITITDIDSDCPAGGVVFSGTWTNCTVNNLTPPYASYYSGYVPVSGLTSTDANGNRIGIYGVTTATELDTTPNSIPQWDTNNRQLKDGLTVVTTVGNPGADTAIPTEQAVREALAGASGSPAGTGGEYQYNNGGSFGAGILKQIDSNSIAINATSVLSEDANRAYLVLKGSAGAGSIEFQTAAADTDGATLGLFQGSDIYTSHTNKRLFYFAGASQGATAAARGGKITFGTKPNNTDSIPISRLQINNDGTSFFGSTTIAAADVVNDQTATSAVFAGSVDIQVGGVIFPDNTTQSTAGVIGLGAVTSQTTFGASSTNGVATTASRSDHTHGTPANPLSSVAAGQVLYGSGTNTATSESVFYYNATDNRLGLGMNDPDAPLEISGLQASNPTSQVHISANASDDGGYVSSLSASGLSLGGGVKRDAGVWTAKSTTASLVHMSGGNITLYADSGLSAGASYTPTSRLAVQSTGEIYVNGADTVGDSGITPDGGFYTIYTAGETLAKGEVVYFAVSGTANNVLKSPADNDRPFGVVYEAATAGNPVKIIWGGRADVLFISAATMGHLAVTSATAGAAESTNTPDTAHHWQEIGHVSSSTAISTNHYWVHLHFN